MQDNMRENANDERKAKMIRSFLLLAMAAVLLIIVVYLVKQFIPDIMALLKDGSHEEIESYLRQEGKKGALVLILLQVLQTITIVFPGIPIYVASGIVYGKFFGTLICYITYVVSNAGVFLFSRRMGRMSEALFSSGKKKGKEDYAGDLLQKTKHPAYVVAALCVIPVVPNGIIPHIAAKTDITFKKFFAAVAVGCLPGIFLFICCGSLILDGHFMLLMVICLIALVLVVIFFLFRNKIMELLARLMK